MAGKHKRTRNSSFKQRLKTLLNKADGIRCYGAKVYLVVEHHALNVVFNSHGPDWPPSQEELPRIYPNIHVLDPTSVHEVWNRNESSIPIPPLPQLR
ncbi:hypothetical protein VTN31DRAFT_2346 [Thermomyces dupontii]|uniref:uncharacterized protein n=1 Tax=Talaromyces thermophilus TaxID=28565 RepID=UPI00374322B6